MALLTGITDGIDEILDSTINKIPTLGAPSPQFFPIEGNPYEIGELHPERDVINSGSPINTGLANSSETTSLKKKGSPVSNGLPSTSQQKQNFTGEAQQYTEGNPETKKAWNGIIKENVSRINTVLEQRSYLDFYFSNNNIGIRRVAFFENPVISESRAPRYAEQRVVARNEPVRLYVGSEARTVQIKFSYTLPHIAHFWRLLQGNLPGDLTAEEITEYLIFIRNVCVQFFSGDNVTFNGTEVSYKNGDTRGPIVYEEDSMRIKEGLGVRAYATQSPYNDPLKILLSMWSLDADNLINNPYQEAVAYTHYAIDTIRASVVGDLTQLGPQGPPLVRLRHGTVFNGATFIVKNFNINYPDTKGYDVKSLLPRVIEFSLTLEEFRQTQGSHHGDITEQLPGAADILDLDASFKLTNLS